MPRFTPSVAFFEWEVRLIAYESSLPNQLQNESIQPNQLQNESIQPNQLRNESIQPNHIMFGIFQAYGIVENVVQSNKHSEDGPRFGPMWGDPFHFIGLSSSVLSIAWREKWEAGEEGASLQDSNRNLKHDYVPQ